MHYLPFTLCTHLSLPVLRRLMCFVLPFLFCYFWGAQSKQDQSKNALILNISVFIITSFVWSWMCSSGFFTPLSTFIACVGLGDLLYSCLSNLRDGFLFCYLSPHGSWGVWEEGEIASLSRVPAGLKCWGDKAEGAATGSCRDPCRVLVFL